MTTTMKPKRLLAGAYFYFGAALILLLIFRPALPLPAASRPTRLSLPRPAPEYLPGKPMPGAAYCDWYNYAMGLGEYDVLWCDAGRETRTNFSYSQKRRVIVHTTIWLKDTLTAGDVILRLGGPDCERRSWGVRELFWPLTSVRLALTGVALGLPGQGGWRWGISVWAIDRQFRPESKVYFVSYYPPGQWPEECTAWKGFTNRETPTP